MSGDLWSENREFTNDNQTYCDVWLVEMADVVWCVQRRDS